MRTPTVQIILRFVSKMQVTRRERDRILIMTRLIEEHLAATKLQEVSEIPEPKLMSMKVA